MLINACTKVFFKFYFCKRKYTSNNTRRVIKYHHYNYETKCKMTFLWRFDWPGNIDSYRSYNP